MRWNLLRLPTAVNWEAVQEALPPVTLAPDGHLDQEVASVYRQVLDHEPAFTEVRQAIADDLPHRLDAHGYLVIELPPWRHEDLRLAAAVLALVGRPFKTVGHSTSLWEELGVNLDADTFRFAGTGFNPPHIDYVNASHPPDYVALLGIRPDPAGGGASLVANLHHAVARLPSQQPDLARLLREEVFHEGKFSGLVGLGEKLHQFPVIGAGGPHGIPWIRFTGKILRGEGGPDGRYREALEQLEVLLLDMSEHFVLNLRQLLIVNNRLLAHGRDPLGQGQADLDPQQRRLLYQTHIRMEGHHLYAATPRHRRAAARHAHRR